MSSSKQVVSCRKNPRRSCRVISELSAKPNKPVPRKKVLRRGVDAPQQKLDNSESCGRRINVGENMIANQSSSSVVQTVTHTAVINTLSGKTSKPRGRRKAVKPDEKVENVSVGVIISDQLENSAHKSLPEPHTSSPIKQTSSHCTESSPSISLVSTVQPTLSSLYRKTKSKTLCDKNTSARTSRGRKPKKSKLFLSSTPQCVQPSLTKAESSCTSSSRHMEADPETMLPDAIRSKTMRLPRRAAAGRPRVRKERGVQEQPPKKRCRTRAGSAVGYRQEETPMEMPSPIRSCSKRMETESQEPDANLSSDLSIELSVQEDRHSLMLSIQQEEDDEDEDEMPSVLEQDTKESLITEGECVWCKLRKDPYWPAVVKRVNHKRKRASIVFIDGCLNDHKKPIRGISVSLRTLKHIRCEESEHLIKMAKEIYGDSVTWAMELISDYIIRIGCGSFSGSFLEYFAADISCPVRKMLSSKTLPTFPSEECSITDDNPDHTFEEEEKKKKVKYSVKLLPDRTRAARNRGNEHLVDLIVNRRGAEEHLLAVLSGKTSSKWMLAAQKPSCSMVDIYLEDDDQVDRVYCYLKGLCEQNRNVNSSLEHLDLIFKVLLPEAVIYAIAKVFKLSLKQAEECYKRGPRIGNRERQEFDRKIEQEMKMKTAQLQQQDENKQRLS